MCTYARECAAAEKIYKTRSHSENLSGGSYVRAYSNDGAFRQLRQRAVSYGDDAGRRDVLLCI
jgi:hypothetical protein